MKLAPHPLKNERGQATTAALLLLPVAVVILTTLILLGFAFIFEANATANCRASLNASQSEARDALERLMALNPKAQKLENARQSAILTERAALASGDSILFAAAEAMRIAIEQAQIPVIASQTRWLTKGRTASLVAPERAHRAIRDSLPSVIMSSSESAPNLVRARFDVISFGPPGARTPAYRTAPGFEQSQRAEVRWLLTLPATSNEKEFSPSINIGCAMTIVKQGAEKWSPQILEDKLLPN